MRGVLSTLLLLLPSTSFADITLPDGNNVDPIVITAQAANRWQMDNYEVWIMRGDVRFAQGDDVANCQEAVFWIDHAETAAKRRTKVIAYLEGDVNVRLVRDRDPVQIRDKKWFGRFFTIRDVQIQSGVVAGKPTVLPEIYQRGMDQRNPEFADTLRQTHAEAVQYLAPTNELPPPGQASPAAGPTAPAAPPPVPGGALRIHIYSRSDVPPQAEWRKDPARNQSILTVEQGITANIEGLTVSNAKVPGIGRGPITLDLSTDRLVAWTTGGSQADPFNFSVGENQPLEIYMEGNVVFREGDRTIYADRMYYDVRHQVGTVLSADVITPAPGYDGKLHFHASVLQQEGPDRFRGQDVFVTPSRLGVPRISLQAGEASFEDVRTPQFDPLTGARLLNPQTGEPTFDHEQIVSAQNDTVCIEDVPVLYWPTFTTDLNDPSFFLRSVRFKQDNVFGTQIYSDFAAYQLLGIKDRPAGTDWTVSLNYLSQRGFSEGTTFTYDRKDFFGISGPVTGQWNFWGIDDHGTDNLGGGRPSVLPEPDVNYRYELVGRHRQELADGLTVWGELGKISDRNFLLEYFKSEWDEQKDPTTDLGLTYRHENMAMSLFAQDRLDNFVTETNWLPRFDHFLLGQSLLADKLTWFEHTSVGYAQFRVGTLPNPAAGDEQTSHLNWEPQNVSGGRFVTRNELDLPLELGPVKVVPYALGEIGNWGQDINGQDLTRAYYQAGFRATLPMWAVDSEAESALWNVHGLAHKVEFQAEYLHAQTNQSVTEFPLYDPLDDQQIEDFRRRYVVNTFGIPPVLPPGTRSPPPPFDERFYAVRTDMQGWVTAPSMEIAANLDELRLGIHERWQTKRGPAENPHIVDWIELDSDFTFFPDANRDNFGSSIGLWDYNFVWHVGDRLTLLSDGIFDFFDQGQKIMTMGMFLTRPPRGALYLGFRVLEGPIDSQILSMSYSYWMSPKWITTTGVTIDMHNVQNVAPAFQLIRVGESLLVSLNLSYDPARNTAGVGLGVEPRFLPKSGKLGSATGVRIPPAGELGVE
jgi:hypothetical protein